jgi:hypothetical protein
VYNDCCLIIQSIKKIYPKGRPHYAAVARQFLDTRLRDSSLVEAYVIVTQHVTTVRQVS